ncbi:MAG: hypothetical protein QOG34_1542 [Frankiaceae bacterium]|nr:hypothetical protein [Frankiaceae bacterium]
MIATARRAAGLCVLALLVFACASSGSAHHAEPLATTTSTPSATPSETATLGPAACAGVTHTTPIAGVPDECQALWRPLGVTKVPPYGLENKVPPPPRVENRTGGAVTGTEARQWAVAANRANVWFQWAEANGQYRFLNHVVATNLLSPDEARILRAGGRVFQPNCVLFPTRVRLFPIDSTERAYFTARGQYTGDRYVFANTYRPRCTVTYVTAAGKHGTLATLTTTSVAFNVGSVQDGGPLLGQIWFQTAYGSCTDQGRPAAWCSG